jgi:hypothetical protein
MAVHRVLMTVLSQDAGGRFSGDVVYLPDGLVLAVGRGAVCCEAARELVAYGYADLDRVEFWRDGILSLSGPLAAFTCRTVESTSEGGLRFRRVSRRGEGAAEPCGRAAGELSGVAG